MNPFFATSLRSAALRPGMRAALGVGFLFFAASRGAFVAIFAAACVLALAAGAATTPRIDAASLTTAPKVIALLRADDIACVRSRVRDGAFEAESLPAFGDKLAQAAGL